VNNTIENASKPVFNGQKLYFTRYYSPTHTDLYESAYDPLSGTFAIPQPLNPHINDGNFNDDAYVTPDGKTLLFARRVGFEPEEILIATWNEEAADWNPPVSPQWPVNRDGYETGPWFCPATMTLYFVSDGRIYQSRAEIPCPFTASDFEPPMGKKRKLGSTLPIKFQLYFEDVPITSQDELDAALESIGKEPACPKLDIYDVTDIAEDGGLELPEDLTPLEGIPDNVGDGATDCFRFTDEGTCIYNLKLDGPPFAAKSTYMVEVTIGDCVLEFGNPVFQTK
jgi:hypothetical protein